MRRLGLMALASALLVAGCGSSGSSSRDSTQSASPRPTTSASASPATASPATVSPTATATATATARASASTRPVATGIKVYGNCRTPAVEPVEIVPTCADFGERFEGLHWSSWTSAQATAIGTLSYNQCMPNCAEGHFRDVPGIHVTLIAPVRGAGGGLVWSRLRMQPTVDHFPSVQTLPVRPD